MNNIYTMKLNRDSENLLQLNISTIDWEKQAQNNLKKKMDRKEKFKNGYSEYFKIYEKQTLQAKYKEIHSNSTPLYIACKYGFLEDVKILCKDVENINLRVYDDNFYSTPLQVAVQYENLDIVKYLINELKADPNFTFLNGENALHIAAIRNNTTIDIIKFLIEKKTNINKDSYYGATPLDYAYESNPVKIKKEKIKLLLDNGGIAKKHDKNGNKLQKGGYKFNIRPKYIKLKIHNLLKYN